MRRLEAALLIGPNAARSLGRRQRLHLRRNAERVEKIGQRQLSDLQTLASARDHQSARRQPLQRLADGRAGDAAMIGKLPLVETVAWLALAFEDFEFEPMNDAGGKRFRFARQ